MLAVWDALTKLTVQKVEQWIESSEENRLPSQTKLAQYCQVSRPTLAKALNLLEDKGTIQLFPRSRGIILSRLKQKLVGQEKLASPFEKLYHTIKSKIRSAEFKVGEVLPKKNSLVRDGITLYQVMNVYMKLEEEGLIYRQGNQYRVTERSIPIELLR